MKIAFNKKILVMVGLFTATFFIINIGMFFFLKATQPKIGHRAEEATAQVAADSLRPVAAAKVDSVKADSTVAATPVVAPADTLARTEAAAPAVVDSTAAAPLPAENVAASVDTPAVESNAQASEMPAQSNPEDVAAALESGDSRQMTKLAKLLESMKPAEAADIASHLTTDQIVVLVMKMNNRTAGRMLAALPIEQAARVAERMSQTASRARGG